jgi:hypothetical protein
LINSRERSSKTSAIGNTTRCDNDNIFSRKRTLAALANVNYGWDQDRERGIASVASTLATLSADDVDT